MNKRRAYLIVHTLVLCALAALLAASVISIYLDGAARRALDPTADIYTPQILAQRLSPLAPLGLIELALLAAGLIFGIRGEPVGKPARQAPVPSPKGGFAVRAILLAAAAALILAGVLNGSARDVLYKAITICTECVGLG